MKRIIIALIFIISLASCTKQNLIESPAESVATKAEFKVSFTVAESQSVNLYSIQMRESLNSDYKEVGIAWPDNTKPENTFTVPVTYIGRADVLYFRVVAINQDKVTTFSTEVQAIKL